MLVGGRPLRKRQSAQRVCEKAILTIKELDDVPLGSFEGKSSKTHDILASIGASGTTRHAAESGHWASVTGVTLHNPFHFAPFALEYCLGKRKGFYITSFNFSTLVKHKYKTHLIPM